MVFRRLRKRGRDRARSSERRRLGKAFQKDGPTTAKLLRWAVASLTLGTTRSPCSAERRDLRPGKDDTGTQSSLRETGAWPARQLRMSIKILKAIRLCIGSQCSSARMNSDICPNLGIPPISRAAAFRTGKTQFIWVGGRVQLSKIDLSILLERFPGVLFSTTVRDFGVTLDQELTLSRHVGSVCRSCFYHLRQI